jgi:hypothetical protein
MDKPTTGIMPSRYRSSQTRTELVRANCGMRRKTGYQISRKRNQATATGNGIDKARQKHQRANNQIFYHLSIFKKLFLRVILSEAKNLNT